MPATQTLTTPRFELVDLAVVPNPRAWHEAGMQA
jgi:hypothetical protein